MPKRRAALCLLAFAVLPAARAQQVVVVDEGDGGVVLSNRGTLDGAVPAAAPLATQSAPRRRPPAAALRRSAPFAPLVRAAATTHGLPEALLQAVIEVESGYDVNAVSPKGALGLMQLMPQTARALSVRDPRDPAANIDGGARYLKDLMTRYGNDVSLALAAYNAGPGAVQRSGGIPRLAETQEYVPRVLVRYHSLQSGRP